MKIKYIKDRHFEIDKGEMKAAVNIANAHSFLTITALIDELVEMMGKLKLPSDKISPMVDRIIDLQAAQSELYLTGYHREDVLRPRDFGIDHEEKKRLIKQIEDLRNRPSKDKEI